MYTRELDISDDNLHCIMTGKKVYTMVLREKYTKRDTHKDELNKRIKRCRTQKREEKNSAVGEEY